MDIIVVEISKYILVTLIAIYTLQCFRVFKHSNEEKRNRIYLHQNLAMILIYTIAFAILASERKDVSYLLFFAISFIVLLITIVLYRIIYPKANRLIVNNMCMLLSIGFIILSRLSFNKAKKQLLISAVVIILTMFIPFILTTFKHLRRFYVFFVLLGIAALLSVLLFSNVINGSKLNINIGGITFQPSEFVKIIYVFGIAGILNKAQDFGTVIKSAVIAAIHILLLVASKDLGSAVIFFVVYIVMLYVATNKNIYLIGGLALGAVGCVLGYLMFSHVRVRVLAFRDPFGTIDNQGYQIAQSLFAIGTGGFFGLGINNGAPGKIPVVEADFIFSAIAEELGVLFACCMILICVSCFVMFMNIAMRFEDVFYKLVALGLAVTYAFQIFLTVGGVTKFIPLTGVTLPLVSYGGNSIMVTLIMFAVIQGLYLNVRKAPTSISG